MEYRKECSQLMVAEKSLGYIGLVGSQSTTLSALSTWITPHQAQNNKDKPHPPEIDGNLGEWWGRGMGRGERG